jgi:sortase B
MDRILTYKIVSAYKYDSRHIMNSFDFYNPQVLKQFQEHTLNPVSTLRNVRNGIELDENSKLVILSTCMTNDKKSRFLVNGVLISDVPIS